MNSKITRGIKITAMPDYRAADSEPGESRFFWSYTIRIENLSADTVTLLRRHWHITDGFGRSADVRGPGVVGKTPTLAPGEAFEYTSGVPLPTPSGTMVGEYEMQLDSGDTFEAEVPIFSLDSPHGKSTVN